MVQASAIICQCYMFKYHHEQTRHDPKGSVRFTVLTKIHEIHYVEVESCMQSYHVEARLNQDCTGSESCVCAHVCTYEPRLKLHRKVSVT